MNRRDFLKKSAIAGGLVAGATTVGQLVNQPKVTASGFAVTHHKSIDELYPISDKFERFEQKNTAFNISFWSTGKNPMIPLITEGDYKEDAAITGAIVKNIAGTHAYDKRLDSGVEPGYGRLDYAFKAGASATESLSGTIFERIFSGDSGPNLPSPNGIMPTSFYKKGFGKKHYVAADRYKFTSSKEASYIVKKVAKKYGASLVGIARYDERWTYKTEVYAPFDASETLNNVTPGPIPFILGENGLEFQREVKFESLNGRKIVDSDTGKEKTIFEKKEFTPKSVIVLAFEMDYETYKTSPSPLANGASSIGYSKMYEVSLSISEFLRTLGYNTLHAGNSIGISGPNAVAAGLGEIGRNGMLITEKFGPRVRLARVYTDLEFDYDKPKSFGVREFCNVCKKCADECPSKAISFADKPSDPENKPNNRSNNLGVENKFYVDGQKCLVFWAENDSGCSNCIASCPYNKIKEWHHDLAKVATKIPGLNRFARYMDEVFGYGEVGSTENMKNYWKKEL